jgi:hypothetical protein
MVSREEFRKYIASERFMHDNFARQVEDGLPAIHDSWREKRHVDPFIVGWPSEHLQADDGSVITHNVYRDLPEDRSKWKEALADFVHRTKPYALMLGERRADEVVVIFESKHGTKSWHYAIEKRGPDEILLDPVVKVDEVSIGLLWSPRMAKA